MHFACQLMYFRCISSMTKLNCIAVRAFAFDPWKIAIAKVSAENSRVRRRNISPLFRNFPDIPNPFFQSCKIVFSFVYCLYFWRWQFSGRPAGNACNMKMNHSTILCTHIFRQRMKTLITPVRNRYVWKCQIWKCRDILVASTLTECPNPIIHLLGK